MFTGLSFGRGKGTTAFNGFGKFLTDADDHDMGQVFAKYFFHLSFATTATTIVSGAMAERVELKAYILFSFSNTISYSLPAHWMWEPQGWLHELNAVDVAGCGPVHLVGGFSGLVATLYLKPRLGLFDENRCSRTNTMASPTNVMLGTFMLWWGWLGFNCGSTFGITGGKWVLASRSVKNQHAIIEYLLINFPNGVVDANKRFLRKGDLKFRVILQMTLMDKVFLQSVFDLNWSNI